MTVSTHVLDAVHGGPARGVGVRLERVDGTLLAASVTDGDGRVGEFAGELEPGIYRLRFDVETYWGSNGGATFYPEVLVTFRISDGTAKHHVPLLLSPYSYSTYRGS